MIENFAFPSAYQSCLQDIINSRILIFWNRWMIEVYARPSCRKKIFCSADVRFPIRGGRRERMRSREAVQLLPRYWNSVLCKVYRCTPTKWKTSVGKTEIKKTLSWAFYKWSIFWYGLEKVYSSWINNNILWSIPWFSWKLVIIISHAFLSERPASHKVLLLCLLLDVKRKKIKSFC